MADDLQNVSQPAPESPSYDPAAEVVELCRELIRIDTSNYGDQDGPGERKAAEYVAGLLDEVGISSNLYESEPGRTSLVARWGDGPGEPLLLHGHLDVVPAAAEDWRIDPFAGEIHEGFVWGRGAVDMKDFDAMALSMVRARARAGAHPNRPIVLCFTADEEAGGHKGAQHIVEQHADEIADCTEAVGEVGGFTTTVRGKRIYLIEAAEKGMAWMKLTARELGDRVVAVQHRAVPRAPPGGQLHPGHALLGGLDQVDATAAHGGAEPSHLADRLGAALEPLGVVLDEGLGTLVPAGLLVGGEAEDDRAFGLATGPGARPDHREQHRVEVLHVDRPAAPQVAVPDLAGERVDLPVLRGGRDDVEVAVQQQRALVAGPGGAPAPSGDDRRPARLGLVEAALDPDLVEQRGDVLSGLALPWSGVVAVVGGVDPDQVAAQLDDLRCWVMVPPIFSARHAPSMTPAGGRSRCGERAPALLEFRRTRPGGGIGRRASLRC